MEIKNDILQQLRKVNIQVDGVNQPQRSAINFLGITAEDDAANDRVNIQLAASYIIEVETASSDEIVKTIPVEANTMVNLFVRCIGVSGSDFNNQDLTAAFIRVSSGALQQSGATGEAATNAVNIGSGASIDIDDNNIVISVSGNSTKWKVLIWLNTTELPS